MHACNRLVFGLTIFIGLISGFNISALANEKTSEEYSQDSITVTADKREKNIQDVPGSLSALNDIQIEDAGINAIKDIHNFVPNFETYSIYGTGGYQSIRGQSNLVYSSAAVGIYIDDVPSTFGYTGVQTSLFDIERIEVLRGPQGNLYGMNSAGGVVNVITKTPGNNLEAKASAEYGNYNLRAYKAALSGPAIADKLFVGLSGSYRIRDSYIDEQGAKNHEEKRMAGRFQLRWTPSEKTEILFTESMDDYYCDFDAWVVPAYGTFKIKNRGTAEGDDITDTTHSLRIKHRGSLFNITSITAMIDNDKYTNAGKDYTSGGDNLKHRMMTLDDKKWMQEIRFASVDKDNCFQWLVGGFYLNGVQDVFYNMRKDTGTAGAPTGIYTEDITDSEIKTKTLSLFGQAEYTFNDKLTLTAGLRLDHDEREIDLYHNKKGVVKADYDTSTSWSSYSPKVALDYRMNDSVMAYASAAKGYKAGGYGYIAMDTPEAGKYDPEYAWSYESGVKTNWLNNKIIANMSIFYTDVDDIQIMYVDPDTWEFSYRNAAEAKMWGIEFESILRPITGLQVIGSFGLLESEFKKHKISKYEGNKVPFAPQYNAGLVVQYNSPWGVYIRGEGSWHGKSYFGENNKYCQDDYWVANARLGYEIGNCNINIYVNNMFDKTYYTIFNRMGSVEKGVTGPPLTCGVQAILRF